MGLFVPHSSEAPLSKCVYNLIVSDPGVCLLFEVRDAGLEARHLLLAVSLELLLLLLQTLVHRHQRLQRAQDPATQAYTLETQVCIH